MTGPVGLELALPPAAEPQRPRPIRNGIRCDLFALIVWSSLAFDVEACGQVQRLHLSLRALDAASFLSIILLGVGPGSKWLEGRELERLLQ